ncbi:MAG: hydrogenase expression/formation protein [Burkholderiales bacterium PBB5]|nr:MAG: hydrogenase expression/formation protein [Burkholderiales bacterium PBB5]
MTHDFSHHKPFPIPVVAGPGSQPEDETLDYITMPSGMDTFRAPPLPEPEDLVGHQGALAALHAVLDALRQAVRGGQPQPVSLRGLGTADLALVHQVLGEGEVSAQVLPAPGQTRVQIQESVFAGVWRVLQQLPDGTLQDTVEVGAIPQVLHQAAHDDARAPRPDLLSAPPGIMNAQPVLTELEDHRQRYSLGGSAATQAQVVNLTLLPLTPEDIGFMDHVLGTGRVLILSRGYGNCRITNCQVPHTWRVVYYNSQDHVILNSVEVTRLPEVACAAPEDLRDSLERLAEVLDWVTQP